MNNIIDHKNMTPEFRGLCAVSDEGQCLIVSGYVNDPKLRTDIMALQHKGVIPKSLIEKLVSPEEIAEAYNDRHEVTMATDKAVERITAILLEATDAKASDVIFELVGDSCVVSAIVNDKKIRMGDPLIHADGDSIMKRLFLAREGATGQTSYQIQEFQGFSIRPGNMEVPLPPGISGIRGERGPHEPDGDHMFLRLFFKNTVKEEPNLSDLGFTAEQCEKFQEVRSTSQGAVILSGTTGAGKSTTLTVNLKLLVKETSGQLNLVTVEDPVENDIPGAIQIPVPTANDADKRTENMKNTLRHFVRIHPAVGMVSEVRDIEGALTVLQFVDTGHPVWFTIHVDNANAIPFRLMDLGVPTPQVCKPGNIALLMQQEIIPLLCDECSLTENAAEVKLDDWLVRKMYRLPAAADCHNHEGNSQIRRRNPKGCPECKDAKRNEIAAIAWDGYERPTAVAEMICPDDEYLSFVAKNDPIGSKRYWLDKLGGVPIEATVAKLVKNGQVDPNDAISRGIRFYQHMEAAG